MLDAFASVSYLGGAAAILGAAAFVFFSTGAVVSDALWRRIPNSWNFLFASAGADVFLKAVVPFFGCSEWACMGVLVLVFLSFLSAVAFSYALWFFRVWGAADAKLFVALALFSAGWLFPFGWVAVFLGSALLISIVLAAYRLCAAVPVIVVPEVRLPSLEGFNMPAPKYLRLPFAPFLVAAFAATALAHAGGWFV